METIMISYGELGTKGKNRKDFIKRLYRNIVDRVKPYGEVTKTHDRLYIKTENASQIVSILKTVSGIKNIAVVKEIDKNNFDEVVAVCRNEIEKAPVGTTFKLKCRRIDKSYPMRSDEIVRRIGSLIESNDHPVNLFTPDITINIELRNAFLIYSDKIRGIGGYPLGSIGRALVLISGGIDSPVAAYQLIRRGILIEAIHFASPPYTSPLALEKVKDLLAKLKPYQNKIMLHVVNFTKVQERIYEVGKDRYAITLMRRYMYRIACQVAKSRHINLLASGDSIGQVASQTDVSLKVIDEVIDLPLIRPLALLDKETIIEQAKLLDTYDISIIPYQDCCTIFTPHSPTTKPQSDIVAKLEKELEDLNLSAVLIETIIIE